MEVAVVEEPVADDRTADRAAETIVVQTRVLKDATSLVGFVDCVEVAVREVLVQRAMQLVGAPLDDRVELAAGGAAKLRAVLVLKE